MIGIGVLFLLQEPERSKSNTVIFTSQDYLEHTYKLLSLSELLRSYITSKYKLFQSWNYQNSSYWKHFTNAGIWQGQQQQLWIWKFNPSTWSWIWYSTSSRHQQVHNWKLKPSIKQFEFAKYRRMYLTFTFHTSH